MLISVLHCVTSITLCETVFSRRTRRFTQNVVTQCCTELTQSFTMLYITTPNTNYRYQKGNVDWVLLILKPYFLNSTLVAFTYKVSSTLLPYLHFPKNLAEWANDNDADARWKRFSSRSRRIPQNVVTPSFTVLTRSCTVFNLHYSKIVNRCSILNTVFTLCYSL